MKKISVCICFFLNAFFGFSQTGYNPPNHFQGAPGDDVFASPDVQAFHEYNMLSENLYAGKVNVNIPLYEIKSGGINIPISLSYNTSGIKVSEVSSNMGLGWSLNAGGSILKIIRDLSDDDVGANSFYYPDDTGDNAGSHEDLITRLGYHRQTSAISTNTYISAINDWRYLNFTPPYIPDAPDMQKNDSSPDFFHVNAPGLSTKFYLKDSNPTNYTTPFENRIYDAIFLDHSGIKIDHSIQRTTTTLGRLFSASIGNPNYQTTSYNTNGTTFYNYNHLDFPSFEITNINGVKYTFGNKDYSEAKSFGYRKDINDGLNSSNWNLTKIVDPMTNKEVNFTYEEYFKAIGERTTSITSTYQTPGNNQQELYHVRLEKVRLGNGTYTIDYQNGVTNYTPKVHRLKTIQWDEGTVEFVYGLSRQDDPDEKALTEIIVKNNFGQVIKHYEFDYSYFISKENCVDKECKRLKLDKIKMLPISGNESSIDHNFTYFYDNPLPKRTSFQRDYLGYYNNNGFEWTAANDDERPPHPTLYFYKDQGPYAILPFQRSNGLDHRILNGNYSITPNNYSVSGSLKKITYPTGGSSSFEYENHTFNLQGAEYIAGGNRVKKQILDDAKGNIREIVYEYKTANGNSSGYVNKVPTFGHLNTTSASDFSMTSTEAEWKKYFTYYDKAKGGLELTDGNFVGYARVIKREIGNGHSEFNFTSTNEYPNVSESNINPPSNNSFFANNNLYPSLNSIDFDVRRGNITEQKVYSESGTILQETNNEYQYDIFDTVNLTYSTYINGNPFYQGGSGGGTYTSNFKVERNLNSKSTTINHLEEGDITSVKEYSYDANYPLLKEEKTMANQGEDRLILKYPFDPEVSTMPYVSNLLTQNRISSPIEQRLIKDVNSQSKPLFRRVYNYADFGNDIISHKSYSESKGILSLEEKSVIDLRDNKGNVKQYHDQGNVYSIIIWGYQHTKPIAVITGATLAEVDTWLNVAHGQHLSYIENLSNLDFDKSSEEDLRIWLKKLQGVLNNQAGKNVAMNFYTYDPLVGITSKTDQKGYTSYYEYDKFHRLISIKDADKNILGTNEYNYKN
ncbi:MAG: YD repeat-containing protein [Clostridium sp.]|jgi:YD repeat-containing protein